MHQTRFPDASIRLDRRRVLIGAGAAAGALALPRHAGAAVSIDVTQGNVQPMPIALPDFVGGGGAADGEVGRGVTQVISANLMRSGLFAPIDPAAYIERISNIDAMPRFSPSARCSTRWSPRFSTCCTIA